MNKHRLGLFNPFSRLAIIALVVTLLMAILDFQDRAKMDQIFKEQQTLIILKKQLTQAAQNLLRARLDESQLINTQKSLFFERFEKNLGDVKSLTHDLSGQFQDEDESDPIVVALIHLDKYLDSVIKTYSLQQKMGLGDADGILNQLQISNQNIENHLNRIGKKDLGAEFAHIQIHEKDFSRTLDMRLADPLMNQIAELSSDIQESGLSQDIKGPLLNEINVYRTLISGFIDSTVELELSIAESALYYSRIAPELSIGQGEIDQQLTQTAAQLRSQRQISTIQTITVFSSAFIILLLLVILQFQSTRQLAKRLQQLANGMKEVAAGHFEGVGELPQGKDDVGSLAETFSAMAKQIRDQIMVIRKAQKKAEIASQAKSDFLANMSHELRTPLNAILGFTQVMQSQSVLTTEQHNDLGLIHQSGQHLLALINDVLDMSKIEAGKFTLNEDTFNLYTLLKTLESMLRFKSETKGLVLIFDCSPTVPQFIKTDEQKLRQVLINLLGNALKFTEVGQVKLQVDLGDRTKLEQPQSEPQSPRPLANTKPAQPPDAKPQILTFTVTDSGPGIAPDELQQLFESFSQGQQGQRQGGTGLGLAISKSFIQLMGGDIRVQSQVGQGSQFSFHLPVELAASRVEPSTYAQPPVVIGLAPGQPDYRILIVENNAPSRLLMVKLLTSVGFLVKAATQGVEAIALCKQWYPHLIWMDINMPVMNGMDATRQIKEWATGQSSTRWALPRSQPQAQDAPLQRFEPTLTFRAPASTHLDLPVDVPAQGSFGRSTVQGVRLPIVIALTANAFETDRQTILSAGCSDFVSKPIQRSLILQKMADYLGACYIYDDVSAASPSSRGLSALSGLAEGAQSQPVLSPKLLLRTMPMDWVKQLHHNACLAERDKINALVNDILNTDPALAQAIQQLIEQFDYERIITCTEQVLNHE